MSVILSKEVNCIIKKIKDNGYKAYVVGGYVRDTLLKKYNYDIDITTSATPDVLKEIFKDYRLEENYINLGCIKFNLGKYHIEITTFRKEYDYSNHRKPDKVEFTTSLEEDLKRRDFTINAICSDDKEIVDLFGGIQDLKAKIIKTIGDPVVRFEEDSLRILRALRFASKLNFKLDERVDKGICDCSKYLMHIPFETKRRELEGILKGENYLSVIKEYRKIFIDVFSLRDLRVDLFNNEMNYEEKEALFFYESDAKVKNKYLLHKDIIFLEDKINLKYKLKKYGKKNIYDVLSFKCNILKENIEEFKMLNDILDGNECFEFKMLNINGEDLLKINIKNNKIGKHLDMLLNAVIENKCVNDKNELLKYLKNNILD